MAIRTTQALVVGVLGIGTQGGDYDDLYNRDLTPYIAAANIMVNKAVAKAAVLPLNDPIDDSGQGSQAEIIERWLAAHYYVQSDQTYSSRSTAGGSGSFRGQSGDSLENSNYGRTAMTLDTSGALRALDKGQRVHGFYGGTPPDEQVNNASNF